MAQKKLGFFRAAMNAVVAARSAQATRYASAALLLLDDETLRTHGYRREDLQRNASFSAF